MKLKICRVPKTWNHPKDKNGNYLPLYTQDYATELTDWYFHHSLWQRGIHPLQARSPILKRKYPVYAQYAGNPPRVEQYLNALWGQHRRTHLQLYIIFHKSVPLSPVFENLEMMERYMESNLKSISDIERFKLISQFRARQKIIEMPIESKLFPPPGMEHYDSTYSSVNKEEEKTYQYRHTDGEFFFCTGDSLQQSRMKKDRWLKNKTQPKGGHRENVLTG